MGLFDIFFCEKQTRSDVEHLVCSFMIGVSESVGIDILECRTIALVKHGTSINLGIDLGGKTSTRGEQTISAGINLAVVDATKLKEFVEFKKVWIEAHSGATLEHGAAYKVTNDLTRAVLAEFAKQSPEYRRLPA